MSAPGYVVMQMSSEEMIRTLLLNGPVPGKYSFLWILFDVIQSSPSDTKSVVSLCAGLKDKNNIMYEHHVAGLWMPDDALDV